MNKTLSSILIVWMMLSVVENVLDIKRNNEYQERQEVLDKRHEKLSNRLEVYDDLVDPKTTQFYIDELEKIVDNMHRLGKIIDKGEEIDVELGRIEKEYIISLDKLETLYGIIDSLQEKQVLNLTLNENKITKVWDSIDRLEKLIDENEVGIISNKDAIKKEISKINETIDTIRKSKYGQKIFK